MNPKQFLRNRTTVSESFLIASERMKGNPSDQIAERFGVEPEVVESDPLVTQAQNSLLVEIRRLARNNLHGHLKMLETIRDEARSEGKYSAAVNAEKARGQVLGFYDKNIHEEKKKGNALEDLSVAELTNLLTVLETKNTEMNDGADADSRDNPTED